MVSRQQDANDRRVRMIFPTEKSRGVFVAIKSVAGDVYEEALAGLTGDERRMLIGGLGRIVENLSDGETPSAEQARVKEQCHERSGQGRSGGR